jgi:hypothetical protein
MNFKVEVPGSVQVGPRSLTTSVAIGTNLDATGPDLTEFFATAGDCTVSVTMVASNEAVISPVNRRRFPLNIALRIDKSFIDSFLIVTEIYWCPSLSTLI